jgi:hypothetical protein
LVGLIVGLLLGFGVAFFAHPLWGDRIAVPKSDRSLVPTEAALAHEYKSETTAAYQRWQKLEKRRALMKDWAQHLRRSNVIPFRQGSDSGD